MTTTEQKIKEAFEAEYGSRNEWNDKRTYDSAWEDFRAGYLALLNSLELEQCRKDAERYRFIRDVPYSENIRLIMRDQKNAIMDAAIDKAMESV